jgi:hypothetical protein
MRLTFSPGLILATGHYDLTVLTFNRQNKRFPDVWHNGLLDY